ncbi:ATP-binding protein [Silvimonas soli]|uniref:ATP-binding protein n=1 Tax=Silvimonas soli TaxID=2980100 RepID=UPI0024B39974|nr:ATP-binding protein [Silvimonas soli]
MDGFKERIKDSLQLRLSLWLAVVILGVAIIAGAFSFFTAQDEAHELQDETLRQVALLFDEHHLPLPPVGNPRKLSDREEDVRVVVQRVPVDANTPGDDDRSTPALSASLKDGMQTLVTGDDTYRVLIKTVRGGARIAVSQETVVRDEIARDSALRTLLPFLILVPVLLLVVADLVRKMFRLIAELSQEIDQRGEQELHPIAPHTLPSEIRPFVVAINRLLGRVAQSMEGQRRFVADAAHELRSPLTALSLQAERLSTAPMSPQAQERLTALRGGIERARILIDQLLTLARMQGTAGDVPNTVSIQHIFRLVLEDLLPLAEAKQLDIGVVDGKDALIRAQEADLKVLVKNLLDNAIRYTPAGGRIDLAVEAHGEQVVLQVDDTGPGISATELARVFDPFYRVLGNDETGAGLGLSIVKVITERIGAHIALAYVDENRQRGLRVRVTFPALDVLAAPDSAN